MRVKLVAVASRVSWAVWLEQDLSAASGLHCADGAGARSMEWRRCTRQKSVLAPCSILYEVKPVALSDIDRSLLDRCLNGKPGAWREFVDRFMGLVVHVVNHTAQCRSLNLSAADREDYAAEVFLAIVENDLAVLRHFRGKARWRLI